MPASTFEDIKRSISIDELLGRYGYRISRSRRIPCPIHKGDGPNFSFTERVFNCFVCGAHGSVIDLYAALEDIPISEAAKKLAEDFQVSPVQASAVLARATTSKVEKWRTLRSEAAELTLPFELSDLKPGYRNLTQASIDHWGLARVPGGVFIPLLSNKGKLCSYSIRRDDGNPKYDNAVGSANCVMMGLYENKHEIIKAGFVYVCEGQFDCVSLWQKGFHNVVALRGSSLTESQAMVLLSLTSKLVLLLDGDEPGRQAARKLKARWQRVFDIGIVDLPDNKDPDELTEKELGGLLV
jgi:DNA primase